jgi:hypothetical protein
MRAGKSIKAYAKELEKLVAKGFPKQNDEARENMLIERFTDGLPREIGHKLDLHPRDTFEAAMTRAEELIVLFEREMQRDQKQIGRARGTAAFTGMAPSWEPTQVMKAEMQKSWEDYSLSSTLKRIEERLARLEVD